MAAKRKAWERIFTGLFEEADAIFLAETGPELKQIEPLPLGLVAEKYTEHFLRDMKPWKVINELKIVEIRTRSKRGFDFDKMESDFVKLFRSINS